jgi:hypothetical protein
MKKILLAFIVVMMFASCEDGGTTRVSLSGDEHLLPPELKGLKVYSVATSNGSYVRVAILNGEVNSVTEHVNKHDQTTILLNKQQSPSKVIEVRDIFMENDSMILCKKK